jgi:hypothetical protein
MRQLATNVAHKEELRTRRKRRRSSASSHSTPRSLRPTAALQRVSYRNRPPPEPDIVIESAAGPVAIELTEFALGDNRRRAAESEQARTLARARALYESDQRPPVHVSVGWAWHLPIVDAERCAERLSRLVANHAPTGNGWQHLDPAPGELSREWPITRISIALHRQ